MWISSASLPPSLSRQIFEHFPDKVHFAIQGARLDMQTGGLASSDAAEGQADDYYSGGLEGAPGGELLRQL